MTLVTGIISSKVYNCPLMKKSQVLISGGGCITTLYYNSVDGENTGRFKATEFETQCL